MHKVLLQFYALFAQSISYNKIRLPRWKNLVSLHHPHSLIQLHIVGNVSEVSCPRTQQCVFVRVANFHFLMKVISFNYCATVSLSLILYRAILFRHVKPTARGPNLAHKLISVGLCMISYIYYNHPRINYITLH